ncbi:phosphate transporter 1;6 [Actinidia rufa]|uniref:Phosphate transporter 16 n=1 Tax=Actinidia rufa TaxID=165716 RepID=A0A7J0GFS5_9ERIC|nr:phosphate transporter 1;6 [Actinidia rufa]
MARGPQPRRKNLRRHHQSGAVGPKIREEEGDSEGEHEDHHEEEAEELDGEVVEGVDEGDDELVSGDGAAEGDKELGLGDGEELVEGSHDLGWRQPPHGVEDILLGEVLAVVCDVDEEPSGGGAQQVEAVAVEELLREEAEGVAVAVSVFHGDDLARFHGLVLPRSRGFGDEQPLERSRGDQFCDGARATYLPWLMENLPHISSPPTRSDEMEQQELRVTWFLLLTCLNDGGNHSMENTWQGGLKCGTLFEASHISTVSLGRLVNQLSAMSKRLKLSDLAKVVAKKAATSASKGVVISEGSETTSGKRALDDGSKGKQVAQSPEPKKARIDAGASGASARPPVISGAVRRPSAVTELVALDLSRGCSSPNPLDRGKTSPWNLAKSSPLSSPEPPSEYSYELAQSQSAVSSSPLAR